MDAALARALGWELDRDRSAGLLDALHLVVDRAVRAVDGKFGATERPRAGLPQRQIVARRAVRAVVDEHPTRTAPERHHEAVFFLFERDVGAVGLHGADETLHPLPCVDRGH